MATLVELPEDIVKDVLHDWIDVRCLSGLDKALTSRRLRHRLLHAFASMLPLLINGQPDSTGRLGYHYVHWGHDKETKCLTKSSFYEWVHLRNLHLRQLIVTGHEYILSDGRIRFNVDLTTIEEVVLLTRQSHPFPLLSKPLKFLQVKNEVMWSRIPKTVLKELSGLYLNLSYSKYVDILSASLWSCNNLRVLRIGCVWDSSYLNEVVSYCPLLSDIHLLCISLDVLEAIIEHCPDIEYIDLYCVRLDQQLLVDLLKELLSQRKSLKYFYCSTKERFGHKSLRLSQSQCERTLELIGYGTNAELLLLFPLMEKLTSFSLKQCTLSDESVQILLKHSASSVKSVTLDSLIGLGPLQSLVKCPLLESVRFNLMLSNVPNHDIFTLPNGLKEVHLILDGHSDLTVVNSIFRCCPQIRHYFFGNVYSVEDHPQSLGEEFIDLVYVRHSQYEDLAGALQFVSGDTIFFGLGNFYH